MTPEGIIICFNDLQWLKTLKLIDFIDGGSVTLSSEIHWAKALFLIERTDDGITIFVSFSHPLKNSLSIVLTSSNK